MKYIDGFLIPVPKKNLKAYQKMSAAAGKIWKKHGALEYIETYSDDINHKGFASFEKAAKTSKGDVVVFSYIVYKSKKHRDSVNKKVMKDPKIHEACHDQKKMPFNVKKMAYGGFKVFVDL